MGLAGIGTEALRNLCTDPAGIAIAARRQTRSCAAAGTSGGRLPAAAISCYAVRALWANAPFDSVQGDVLMKYLHTMLRVRDLDAALHFYVDLLGMKEARRRVDEKNKFTLVFLYAPDDEAVVKDSMAKTGRDQPMLELTYNWDTEDYGEARYFGHLAFEVDDIYATCEKLMKGGVTINRPPRDGNMAFVRSPDRQSIEILQKGKALAPQEPWASMKNTGHW